MKKIIIISLILISIISAVFIYNIIFGHIKSREMLIENFSNNITDTLYPYKGKPYSSQEIRVKGYVNDTILIKGIYGYPIYLNGEFDKNFNSEYYGSYPSIIELDFYKASKGKLEFTHIIK